MFFNRKCKDGYDTWFPLHKHVQFYLSSMRSRSLIGNVWVRARSHMLYDSRYFNMGSSASIGNVSTAVVSYQVYIVPITPSCAVSSFVHAQVFFISIGNVSTTQP